MKFVRHSHIIEARNNGPIGNAVDAFYELSPAVKSTTICVVMGVIVIILAYLLWAAVYVITESDALQL